jgi:hypothetical protein
MSNNITAFVLGIEFLNIEITIRRILRLKGGK